MTQVQYADDDGGAGRGVPNGLGRGRRRDLQGQPTPLSRHQLEGMIEQMGFGLIDRLLIIQGQAQSSPKPRCRRVFKLVPDAEQHSTRRSARAYRVQTMETLFRRLESVRGHACASILVQEALPIRLTITELDES
jgi:hypothetical protein